MIARRLGGGLSETFNKAKHKDTLALLDEGRLQLPNTWMDWVDRSLWYCAEWYIHFEVEYWVECEHVPRCLLGMPLRSCLCDEMSWWEVDQEGTRKRHMKMIYDASDSESNISCSWSSWPVSAMTIGIYICSHVIRPISHGVDDIRIPVKKKYKRWWMKKWFSHSTVLIWNPLKYLTAPCQNRGSLQSRSLASAPAQSPQSHKNQINGLYVWTSNNLPTTSNKQPL